MSLALCHSKDSNLSGSLSQMAVAGYKPDPLCSYPKPALRDNWLTFPTQMSPHESLNFIVLELRILELHRVSYARRT